MRRRAHERQRSIEDEAAAIMARALADDISPSTAELLEQLAFLSEDDLWQAAQVRVPQERAERMQALVWKQQTEGLTAAEDEEATQLQDFARQVMLVRADAATILSERGHDVSSLLSPAGA